MSALTLFLFLAIRGVVKDASGQPLGGAAVSIDNGASVVTSPDGAFAFDADGHRLRVTRSGFQPEVRDVKSGDVMEIELRPALAETIVVSGIRADDPRR